MFLKQLTQEKNDLREEKSSIKSDIENLNVQYQQRMRTMYPWAAMDHSVVMAPPSYPYPVPMPMPPGAIPMHPHMQPYPFYGNQNPGVIPNPCSTFVPYITPSTLVEQQSQQYVSPVVQPGSRSNVSGKQDSRNKSSGESKIEKSEDSNDVATNLELKTPGSATDQVSFLERIRCLKPSRMLLSESFWTRLWKIIHLQDSGQGQSQRSVSKENNITERSSSSRCSSSRSVQDSSSNSIVSSRKANDWKYEDKQHNKTGLNLSILILSLLLYLIVSFQQLTLFTFFEYLMLLLVEPLNTTYAIIG